MVKLKLAPLAAALVATAGTASAEQFNLVCKGEFTSGTERKPSLNVYRLDTGLRRWCRENCDRTHPILSINDNEYRLLAVRDAEMSGDLTINRRTGELYEAWTIKLGPVPFGTLTKATCEKVPFTGFPAAKF